MHVDTELGAKDLLNNRMAYVSISRGQWDAQIFTNDAAKLAQTLSRDVSHQSALQKKPPMQERGIGMGIGLAIGM